MLFHSYTFVFAFLPVVWLVYQLLARVGARAGLAWLVAASLFFYGWWDPRYLALLGFSMAFNYTVGRGLDRRPGERKGLLALGVAVNLGLLGYFKYTNFLVDTWDALTGGTHELAPIVLPLAISFFTFQQIAYLVDAHRGETREHDLLAYALFVTFFPQLIAGPIVHHKEMLPQFARKGRGGEGDGADGDATGDGVGRAGRRLEDLSVGLTLFVLGLFKKIVLADGVSGYANTVFGAAAGGQALGAGDAWMGLLAYTFQIYFDFSGYSDMAIGLGRLFGIRLPLNFASPYKATSIVDFWRRWHMTLSRFLRDYLYFALGGNRKGRARRHLNLLATMLLGGLWHGAGWNFVIWGGLHGSYLVVNHAWRALLRAAPGDGAARKGLPPWLGRLITFGAVVLAWVFFRAEGFPAARTVLAGLVGAGGATAGDAAGGASLLPAGEVAIWLGVLLALAWFAPNTQELLRRFRPAYDFDPAKVVPGPLARLAWRPSVPQAVVLAALFVTCVLSMNRVREFLYFQF